MRRSTSRGVCFAGLVLVITAFLALGTRIAPHSISSLAMASRANSTPPILDAAPASNTVGVKASQGIKPVANDTGQSDLTPKSPKAKPGPGSPKEKQGDGVAPPANDNCANAISINSCPFTDTRDTRGATDEEGEQNSTCAPLAKSVWYTYAPGAFPAQVTVDTCLSNFDTVIMVWRVNGAACGFANFVAVACNDDFCGDGFQSSVSFLAAAGQTYKIQVGGFDGDSGNLVTRVACTVFTCPPVVIHGTLGSNDPTFPGPRTSGNQLGRLTRNLITSSCAAPKSCLISTATGSRAFDAYTFTNNSGSTACVTVVLNVLTQSEANYQSDAYLGSFDPNNICTNYLADPGRSSGSSPPNSTSFSFNVAAGASFVVDVHTTTVGQTGGLYDLLTGFGNICGACQQITCPGNSTVSNTTGQCGAVVTYSAPTPVGSGCGTITCSPASGSFFPVGTTTVSCTSTGGPACSFTVRVQDTQAPTITCPANVTAVTEQNSCPAPACQTVNFPAPTAADNCPGVGVVCSPAAGTCFPVGITTVTCTATDTSGNTATCSFTVTVFDTALQDDSTPSTILLWNSLTGQYRFCCAGATFSGTGNVVRKGCVYTLEHNPSDRRVLGKVDKAVHAGNASIQAPPGTIRCTITDRNTLNDTLLPACQ